MREFAKMPEVLNYNIGSENRDFVVKAGRAQPARQSFFFLFFGTFWLAFTSIFFVAFLGPLFVGKEVHFESDGVPTVASPDNLGPILVPALIIGIFVLVGLAMFFWGLYTMFKKGGYFVGTPLRLVHYQNGRIRSIDWEQFSGDIEISGDHNKGNISLMLRTGKMVSSKNSSDRYVPDVVYLSSIPNAFKIEEICRRRIKENDPTPTHSDFKTD